MLIGIDPLLTPELLHALAAMGHGDRIVLVDGNYPATRGRRLIRQPSADTPRVLRAILSLLPCDTYVDDPAQIMEVVGDPNAVPSVVGEMNAILTSAGWPKAIGVERHAFYEGAETAYAIVQTGERRFYGNVLLTKGVIAPDVSMPGDKA
ncbi:MAG: ribose ABC transporter [Alphaproteobacteria bacterium]|nr:ribose ABC transporter [Alphaproteobacteria bacterium]